jgi:hypothetical protein
VREQGGCDLTVGFNVVSGEMNSVVVVCLRAIVAERQAICNLTALVIASIWSCVPLHLISPPPSKLHILVDFFDDRVQVWPAARMLSRTHKEGAGGKAVASL